MPKPYNYFSKIHVLKLVPFLIFRSCPASLEASLTRAVLDEAKSTYLSGSTFAVSIPNQDEDQIDASTPPATTSSTCNYSYLLKICYLRANR